MGLSPQSIYTEPERIYALIVDDAEFNRDLLGDILEDTYEPLFAADGEQALALLQQYESQIAVVLLDLIMPVMDGHGVLKRMNELGLIQQVPVLIITGDEDPSAEERCLSIGAMDFIRKPFGEVLVKQRVANITRLFTINASLEQQVAAQTIELRQKNEQLQELNEAIIEMLGQVVEARHPESGDHIQRVKEYSFIIGADISEHNPELGLSLQDVNVIATVAPLHDVGKIKIRDDVLMKPGKLTADEWDHMKEHTVFGEELIAISPAFKNEPAYYEAAREVCRSHHERWDGSGYPDGLVGEQIPLSAQIVSLADVWDALINDRTYKKAFPLDVAFDMIVGGQCGMFNPVIIESLKRCVGRMSEVAQQSQQA